MTRFKTTIIAIDGHSACGKSTLATDLAKRLNIIHIDSGAMYRAVSLYLLRNQIDPTDRNTIVGVLSDIFLEFKPTNSGQSIFLNGENVDLEARSKEVTAIVSEVSTISEVRRKLVHLQREMGGKYSLVMDGRDIGTVVFPNATLKIFLTADIETRIKRRMLQLAKKKTQASFEEIKANLEKRDYIDSTRKDSPLKRADDAVILDNSNLSRKEQLEFCLAELRKKG